MKSLSKLFLTAFLALAVLIGTPSIAGAVESSTTAQASATQVDPSTGLPSGAVAAPFVGAVETPAKGGVKAAAAGCLPGWMAALGCIVLVYEFGSWVYKQVSTGRHCANWHTEWLINSSNGSVMGTRKVCTKWVAGR
jgi:hypothetical protein